MDRRQLRLVWSRAGLSDTDPDGLPGCCCQVARNVASQLLDGPNIFHLNQAGTLKSSRGFGMLQGCSNLIYLLLPVEEIADVLYSRFYLVGFSLLIASHDNVVWGWQVGHRKSPFIFRAESL